MLLEDLTRLELDTLTTACTKIKHCPQFSSRLSNWPLLYTAVALTTLATLLLELSLTRIFSVVFYYHFAFLAISIALFGLGVGGVLSYLISGWPGSSFRKLRLPLRRKTSGMLPLDL